MIKLNKTTLLAATILIGFAGTANASVMEKRLQQAQESRYQQHQQQQQQQQLPGGINHTVNPDGSMSAQSQDGYSITEKDGITTGHFPDGRKLIRYKKTGKVFLYYPTGQYIDITDRLGDPSLNLMQYNPRPAQAIPGQTPRQGSRNTNTKNPSHVVQRER